jgi:hemolysin III
MARRPILQGCVAHGNRLRFAATGLGSGRVPAAELEKHIITRELPPAPKISAMNPNQGSAPASTATYMEERFNSGSHLLGAILALLGTVVLLRLAVRQGDAWRMTSFAVYGMALMGQYITSFLYHSATGPSKTRLRHLDHCAIYLLIAGTYSPFTMVTLRGNWGWPLFVAIWALAILGIVQENMRGKKNRFWSLALYILMGWLAILAVVPLVSALTYRGFAWIAAGGLLYTGGVYFYVASKKGLRYGHGIWHVFVLAGSACHYLAVLFFVA